MPRVRDLFDVTIGHSLELNRMTLSREETAINFVSRTTRNNGVSATVAPVDGLEPAPAGAISVALSGNGVLAAFVQPTPFLTGYHVAILRARRPMTDQEKLWWCTCITSNRYRYSFGRQANRTVADLVLPDDVPDWVAATLVPDLSGLRAPAIREVVPLRTSDWRPFRYDDLFEFAHGERVTKEQLKPGSTPFLRATERHNGLVYHADLPAAHPAGVITVSYNGSVGEAFYQPVPFFASDDVFVLTPKEPIGPAAALFLCVLIRAEKFRFSYGRKWNMERMKQSMMRLPVTAEGKPDWEFATRFVRSLPYSSSIYQEPAS